MKFAKKNKKGLLIGVAAVSAAVVGGIIHYKVKNRESAVVTQFRVALRIYIREVRNGHLEGNTIRTLMAALDELKQHRDYEKFKIKLSTENLDVLVSRIYDYTICLAENNKVELTEAERSKTDNPIINLQNYLRTQKRIFKEAV